MINVKFVKQSVTRDLENWQRTVREIKEGTLQKPHEPWYEHLANKKVEIFTSALDYLNTLEDDLIMVNGTGGSNEFQKYLKIVNS